MFCIPLRGQTEAGEQQDGGREMKVLIHVQVDSEAEGK